MAERLSSNFFGCVNPCNIEWQKFLNDQVKLEKGNIIEKWFLNDMGECEECKIKFTLFRRKRLCYECSLAYCSSCLTRNNEGQRRCNKCTILSHWPVNIDEISSLRVRDLRHYLNSQKIRTDTIREKKDLVDLVAYHLRRRRGVIPSRRSQDFQAENSASSARSRNVPYPSVLRDDGIRVRPVRPTNTESDGSRFSCVASSSTADCEASGIRVFASSDNKSTIETAENQESSDDASSDWSFLLSDTGPLRSPPDSSSASPPNVESESSTSQSNNLDDGGAIKAEHVTTWSTGGAIDAEHVTTSSTGGAIDAEHVTTSSTGGAIDAEHVTTSSTGGAIEIEHEAASHPENAENIIEENSESLVSENTETISMEEPEILTVENLEDIQSEDLLQHIFNETLQNDVPGSQPTSTINLTVAADVIKLSSIENEESIKNLSVRQCKEILSLNRVDYSGVWEKHELVSKVQMLWRDYKQRTDIKDVNDEQLCKICMDAVMDCVLLECGHIVSCTDCGKQMSECPVCRQNVIRVVKTFRA